MTDSTKRIKVTQVPTDMQQSHADFDYEEAIGIAITGNNDCKEWACEEFKEARKFLNSDDDESLDYFHLYYKKKEKVIYIKKFYVKGLSTFSKAVCDVLSTIGDTIWLYGGIIHGDCQSDWQVVYYDSKIYNDEQIRLIEMDYFNLGSEWRIDEGDGCPWYFYSHKYNEEEIKKEILNELGVEENEVEFRKFTGYIKQANYEEF